MVLIGLGEAAVVPLAVICISFFKFGVAVAATTSIIAITAYFLWTKHINEYWKRRGVPGPETHFFFGNTFQLQKGFATFDIENMKRFGRFYGASFMGYPELNVCDLDMLRRIFIQDFGTFQNRVISDFFIGNQTIRKHMVNVMSDQHWKDVRRTITPAFSSGRIAKMVPIMSQCIRTAEALIDRCIKKSNGKVEAKKVFANLALDVIAQSAFGVDLSTQKQEDSKFIYYSQKVFQQSYVDYRVMFLAFFPNVARFCERIFNFQLIGNDCDAFFERAIRKIIEERRQNPRQQNPDFLQLLLNTTEDSENVNGDQGLIPDALSDGRKIILTDLELAAQGYLFLAVGYETTSTTLAFAAYSLAANPQVQEIARAQIMDVVGDKENIDYDDLMKMPYLEQIMNETLRMYPPAPRNDRKCGSDITVDGITIEKGTFVYAPIFALHYDERYYPNPERFDPERFSPSEKAKRDPLAFMPFGVGPRNCIGMRFAQIEFRLTLAYLLRKFQFSVPTELQGVPLEVSTTGMTKPKTPITITARRRTRELEQGR